MELKSYQKKVIADLTRYLELLNETKSDAAAFRLFWQEKSAPALGRYQNVRPGVPNLCFKVPTGGGKTFIACNAVRPIFDALPAILPLSCVCWMRKRGYWRSVPARATNRRDSSSPRREANRKVLLRSPTRICLTRFALSPARTGFPASVTGCAGSGLPMQKPCALTLMRAFRRTFALLRRAMTQNNP